VIDIRKAGSPAIVGSVDTPGIACSIAVAGRYAYVADWGSGLHVIDIADPANPAIVGNVHRRGYFSSVAVAGDYAYITDWESGLQVIDITDPASPRVVGRVDLPGYPRGVAIAGSYAYVVTDYSGLRVIDVTDPASPKITGSVHTPGDALGVVVAGGDVYLAAGSAGLQIVPPQCQSMPRETSPDMAWGRAETPRASFAILPNPVRGTARIRFDLLQASNVELTVYDVAGRRVRQVVHGPQGAGSHVFAWDGTNDDHQAVPAGVYFIRLEREGVAATERVVLLR
jgi:hypothetical protein